MKKLRKSVIVFIGFVVLMMVCLVLILTQFTRSKYVEVTEGPLKFSMEFDKIGF